MKTATFALLALVASSAFAGDVYVEGYTRNNGTYVAPHYQTAPDNTRMNNYSTQGNVNPYTGQAGTVNPYAPPSYGVPQQPMYQPFQPMPNPYAR